MGFQENYSSTSTGESFIQIKERVDAYWKLGRIKRISCYMEGNHPTRKEHKKVHRYNIGLLGRLNEDMKKALHLTKKVRKMMWVFFIGRLNLSVPEGVKQKLSSFPCCVRIDGFDDGVTYFVKDLYRLLFNEEPKIQIENVSFFKQIAKKSGTKRGKYNPIGISFMTKDFSIIKFFVVDNNEDGLNQKTSDMIEKMIEFVNKEIEATLHENMPPRE